MPAADGISLHRFTDVDDSHYVGAYIRALEAFDGLRELQELKSLAIERSGPSRGQSVLDVGCGFGLETLRLAGRAGTDASVVGLDKSARFIAEARRRATAAALAIAFRVGDAEAIPYADATFDCVRAERLLIYLADPARAVAEMRRVTRPGGRLAFIEPDFDTNAINVGPRDLTRRILAHECDHGVVQGWLVRDFRSLLERLGLQDIAISTRLVIFEPALAAAYFTKASASALADGAIDADEQRGWAAEVERRRADGSLFASIGYYLFTAQRPDR